MPEQKRAFIQGRTKAILSSELTQGRPATAQEMVHMLMRPPRPSETEDQRSQRLRRVGSQRQQLRRKGLVSEEEGIWALRPHVVERQQGKQQYHPEVVTLLDKGILDAGQAQLLDGLIRIAPQFDITTGYNQRTTVDLRRPTISENMRALMTPVGETIGELLTRPRLPAEFNNLPDSEKLPFLQQWQSRSSLLRHAMINALPR